MILQAFQGSIASVRLMLKRLQSARMYELGDSANVTKLRRASKMEFDIHGIGASINMLSIRPLSDFAGRPVKRGAVLRAG